MSRTDTKSGNKVPNPMKRYLEFKGSDGVWTYWNGTENVLVDTLDFVLLDIRASITGWSDSEGKSLYSNYFKSTKEPVSVRTQGKGGKELVNGTYAENKDEIQKAGGKYTTNLFTLAFLDGEYVPAVISLTAACLRDWSAFVTQEGLGQIYKYLITAVKGPQQKKGSVKYYTPTFTVADADESLCERADIFTDEQLAPFLNQG